MTTFYPFRPSFWYTILKYRSERSAGAIPQNNMDQFKLGLADKLASRNLSDKQLVIGFDGFVDEIVHPVDKRLSIEDFTRITTIRDFAARIDRASGLSTNIELVPVQRKIGGNGPIMTHALAKHRPEITYIGTLGVPTIDRVFLEMEKESELISISDCGHTDAYEFTDGKLLFGKMSGLNGLTYERMVEVTGENRLLTLFEQADLFCSVNWSMLPYMSDIWEKIQTNLLPKIPKKAKKPLMFVDLADPEKRDRLAIEKALKLIKGFQSHFTVILGLNKKEAYELVRVLNLFDADQIARKQIPLERLTKKIAEAVRLDGLVVHPVECSATMLGETYAEAAGPFCADPKLTTGAGDNFNAGYVLGLLLGFDARESLTLGMATSGFYVRQAKSPTTLELADFIRRWAKGNLE